MGTRHLIAVQLDGQYRIAQYGQWDGYPSGQGLNVLKFIRQMDRPKFEAALRACSFLTPEDIQDLNEKIKREGLAERWQRRWPELSRDAGSDILSMVDAAPAGLRLKNSISFAADSLFCEWAYVIDLDVGKLEVFTGFNKEPLAAGDRFALITCDDAHKDYRPVRKVGEWPLGDLPSDDAFVKALEPQDDEEEEQAAA